MPSDTASAVAAAIRDARTAKGFTQESFAAHIDLDRSYYGAIERGEHNITLDTLTAIAEGLGTPAWKLLRQAHV